MTDPILKKKTINDTLNMTDNKNDSLIDTQKTETENNSSELDTVDSKFSKKKNNIIGETSYRFFILFLFCLLSFANGMQWVTFAPIATKFREVYKVNTFQVDLFSMLYMIVYPIVNFPVSYLLDNKSVRLGVGASAFFTLLGAVFKSFLNTSLVLAYVGQGLAAIANTAILNSPGKIASTWFREDKRILATTICILSNTIGIIFGYLFPTYFVSETMSSEEYKSSLYKYLLGHLIISVICCLPVIFFFKSKPKIPPSHSQNNYKSPPLLECLKLMFKNINFIKFLIMFTFILGYFNLYGTILNGYYTKYGLTDTQTSYVSSTANFVAMVGSLIVSAILDKFKSYRKAFLILNGIGFLCHITLTVTIEYFETYGFYILLFLWTMASTSILPVYTCGMDFVVELTYPVGETISGGLIMTVNQIFGFLAVLISDALMESFPNIRYLTNVFSTSFFIISFIALYLIEENLLRHQKDKEGKEKQKNSEQSDHSI